MSAAVTVTLHASLKTSQAVLMVSLQEIEGASCFLQMLGMYVQHTFFIRFMMLFFRACCSRRLTLSCKETNHV